jgi:endonuclease/exonuclease/phosphatase family metal-dependent hydrolase
LNTGINAGINPPTTRLGGTAKANLRYIDTGTKATNAYTITGNKLQVAAAATPGRFVLSADGMTPFDFGPALGIPSASATNPIVYDLSVRMKNDSAGTQRFAFALGTTEGDANTWDFGVQIYRTNSGNNFYTIGKRIDTGSSGLANDLNEHILSLTPNTFGNEINVLIRVTDAGSETTTFNSRARVSLNGGNSWIYDTDTDPDLAGTGWRLNGPGRIILWDIAGDAGPVTYDAFSLKLNPPTSNVNTSAVFRSMSYNIHWAAGPDGEVDTQRISDFIINENVDIVGFNEVARFWSQRASGRDTIGEISEQTGMAFVFDNNKDGLSGNDSFGNAILSKYPILFRDHRLLPKVGDNEQRGWHKAVVEMGNGKFISFWTSHLDFHADNTERLMCGTNFNTWIDDETLPVIFVGDFNDTPNTPIYDLLEKKWTDIWTIAGDGTLGRTVPCPGPPGARIDYIWKAKTSTSLVPTNAEVGLSLEASDHFSVLTQFILTNFTNHATGFYFPFDQGSGTTVTDSVSGLKGTFTAGGSSWNTNSPTGHTNDFSLFFNGARRVTLTDTNQIIGTNGLNDNYTLQAWVKLAVNYLPTERAVLFQYERKPGFSLSINTNRTLHTTTFKIKDISTSAAFPNDGQWHHVAVVHTDGANMKFYIDANLAATIAYTNGAGYRTDSTLTIGSAEDGANPFTGYLDRISFDERALAPAQFDFPAIPPLGIRKNGNALTVFWPTWKTGYVLQMNSSLDTTNWTNVSTQAQGNENQATITPTNSAKYFRLKRQ